jgi:hypothetical protein
MNIRKCKNFRRLKKRISHCSKAIKCFEGGGSGRGRERTNKIVQNHQTFKLKLNRKNEIFFASSTMV